MNRRRRRKKEVELSHVDVWYYAVNIVTQIDFFDIHPMRCITIDVSKKHSVGVYTYCGQMVTVYISFFLSFSLRTDLTFKKVFLITDLKCNSIIIISCSSSCSKKFCTRIMCV